MLYHKDLLKVQHTEFPLAPGRILISTPYSQDAFFRRSVVLLTDYGPEHVAGLIVNHCLELSVGQLVDEVDLEEPMYFGGPVMPTALFLLHSFESCPDAAQVVPGVFVGYNQVLLSLIEHHAIPALRFRFMMGYAGWSPGQLEDELKHNVWVVGNPTADLIFNTAPEDIWAKSVRILGKEYEHWLQVPESLILN